MQKVLAGVKQELTLIMGELGYQVERRNLRIRNRPEQVNCSYPSRSTKTQARSSQTLVK